MSSEGTVLVKWPRCYRPHLAAGDEDETRDILKGVYVDPAGYLIAANGFVLTAVACGIEFPGVPVGHETADLFEGAVIPAWLFQAVMTDEWIGDEPYDHAYLAITDGLATLEGMSAKLMQGKYPRWHQLVPREHVAATRVLLNPELTEIVGRTFNNAMMSYTFGASDRDAVIAIPQSLDGFAALMPWWGNEEAIDSAVKDVIDLANQREGDPSMSASIQTLEAIRDRWRRKATPGPTVQQARHDVGVLFEELQASATREIRWQRVAMGAAVVAVACVALVVMR